MKVIISRKGSDSSSGRMPSPILPCGCLCSIPIPYRPGVLYSDIWFGNKTLHEICTPLQKSWKDQPAHLDPDLRYNSLSNRPPGWRPAFGQCGSPATHLNDNDVGEGDLFVFFGWFRRTEAGDDGVLRFCRSDRHGRHIIFGWLQVEKVIKVGTARFTGDVAFLNQHPHARLRKKRPNQIYLGSQVGLGTGLFGKEHKQLVLTRPNYNRSEWRLPPAFQSVYRQRDMTFHDRTASRWKLIGEEMCLTAVSRGQEFVIDGEKHGAVVDYFSSLIKSASKSSTPCPHHQTSPRRQLGSAKGEFTVPDDFDSADAEIEKLFYDGDPSFNDPLG